ncbi:MAG: DNA repair exonuclease [Rhodocyclaceae bacterium]|jgi:DNA repair exonuclease SbcCD nuclease subunit|nr:DNA repair exonuclease [Rhodocyclaceae bacterium]
MPRFIHTADWQIGRQYSRFAPDSAHALAEARLTTVERIASLASEEKVDAVLVAGDVFDTQTVADLTLRRLFNALAPYSGPWVMIPGNHDAALAESVWTRALRLGAVPANVHLALVPGVIELPEAGVAILAAPLTQRHTHGDLTAWFDGADTGPGLARIGLAHGSVEGVLAEDIDSPNPIAADRTARARLDYLALGDWHGAKRIDERTWYSGTPEQERFKDNGAGQVLLVTIEAPGALPQVEARPVGQFPWHQWRIDLTVATDLDQFIQQLESLLPHSVLDLHITGQLDLSGHQRLQNALSVAEARQRSLTWDTADLRLEPTDEDIAALHADGFVGEVLAELRERQQGPEGETAREALAILTRHLLEARGGEVAP